VRKAVIITFGLYGKLGGLVVWRVGFEPTNPCGIGASVLPKRLFWSSIHFWSGSESAEKLGRSIIADS